MSSNKTKLLDPGLCRCCKSIKKCRLLTTEYIWMGKKEVYSEMMMDCFGLLLSYVDGDAGDCGVCATCVVRLREACAFRQQVLQCEETFLQAKLRENNDGDGADRSGEIEVKTEPENTSDEDNGPSTFHSDVDEDTAEQEANTVSTDAKPCTKREEKQQLNEKSKSKPLQRRKTKKKQGKLSEQISQESMKNDLLKLRSKLKRVLHKPDVKKKIVAKKRTEPSMREYMVTSDEQFLAEDNIIAILENSYIYPFKNRSNNLYCFYCKEYCAKPDELRTHTWTHDPKTFKDIMCSKLKFYYVDITRIDCRLCTAAIDSLEAFKQHATEAHTVKIHPNVTDRFIQFRLTFTNLTCCICREVSFDFNTTLKHMVEHYRNFTCDICGLSFLEETGLTVHMRSHKAEKKHPCEVCGKIFKSKFYKDSHVDTVHNKIPIVRCSKCEEMFLSYTQRNKHLIDAHGVHKPYPCNMCDKVYDRRKTLTEHQRRTHIKVLKHRCEYCEQRFYLPSRLKEHMATHTGERNVYRCDACDKSYPRLKSLQDHLKSHSEERRFRCHVCGQGFLQNVSLRNHIKSVHPECEMEGFF